VVSARAALVSGVGGEVRRFSTGVSRSFTTLLLARTAPDSNADGRDGMLGNDEPEVGLLNRPPDTCEDSESELSPRSRFGEARWLGSRKKAK
jgi:hypothetical protein